MTPPKDYTDFTLDANKVLDRFDKAQLGVAVQRLLAKSRLGLHDHPKGGRCLRFVSEEVAQQQVERQDRIHLFSFIHQVPHELTCPCMQIWWTYHK
jgi:hypothetical protein